MGGYKVKKVILAFVLLISISFPINYEMVYDSVIEISYDKQFDSNFTNLNILYENESINFSIVSFKENHWAIVAIENGLVFEKLSVKSFPKFIDKNGEIELESFGKKTSISLDAFKKIKDKNTKFIADFNGSFEKIDLIEDAIQNGATKIYLDYEFSTSLVDSISLIGIDQVNNTGLGKIICILDTGSNHSGYDFVNYDDEPQDDNGHGSLMASIISKIAPDAKILSIKVLNENGTGFSSDIISGLHYCDEQNSDIVLMAFGGGNFTEYCVDHPLSFTIQNSSSIVVASTGNNGGEFVTMPACVEQAIAVSSTTKDNQISSFSNIHPIVDFLAPGEINLGSGTSISAAIFAATLSIESNLSYLESIAVPIEYNNINFPRVNLLNNSNFTPSNISINETNESVDEFQIQAYEGCVDLTNQSTWNGNLYSMDNKSFIVQRNVTLCTQTYFSNTLSTLFKMNGSFELDCNGSKITGSGLGTGVLSFYNNTVIKNCIFDNFKIGVNILKIDTSDTTIEWNWSYSFHNQNDGIDSILVDHEGNYVAAGYSHNQTRQADWRVVKLSPEGNVIWNWTQSPSGENDYINKIILDQDHNYLAAGYWRNVSAGDDWRIVKLTRNGSELWTYTLSPSSNTDHANDIAVDNDGDYLIGGSYFNGARGTDWLLVKLNPSGTSIWNWTLSPTNQNEEITTMAIDLDENYLVAGYYLPSGNRDWLVYKIDHNGSTVWNWTETQSTNQDQPNSMLVDYDGNIVVGGTIYDGGDTDYHLVKISSNGSTIWSKTYYPSGSSDQLKSVALDQDGNYILGGSTQGSQQDYYAMKIAPNGSVIWNFTTSPSTQNDIANAVTVDQDGNYIFGGFYQGSQMDWRVVKISPRKLPLTGIELTNVEIYDENTTSFIALPNANAIVTNFTVGYNETAGKIKYLFLVNANGTLSTNRNILVNPTFVSLNGTNVGSFNSDANITLEGGCIVSNFTKALNFPQTRVEIISTGSQYSPVYSFCQNNIVTFSTTAGFSGYTVAGINGTPVDPNCPIINSSGNYNQTLDFTGSPNDISSYLSGITACLIINSSNVIYDCGGYSILGNSTDSVGILVLGSNVTLENCSINNYTFGIYSNSQATIANNIITNNTNGIYLNNSNHSLFSNYICFNNFDINNSATNTGSLNYCNSFKNWKENSHLGCTFSCSNNWQIYFGDVASNILLISNNSIDVVYNWGNAPGFIVHATDIDAVISWSDLYPIGYTISNLSSSNDFEELDSKFGTSGFDDINTSYSLDGSTALFTDSFIIFGKTITNVPITNSSSIFETGIFWDSSDGGSEYNGTQSTVWSVKVNSNSSDIYGTYDYLLQVPASLSGEEGSKDVISLYLELQ